MAGSMASEKRSDSSQRPVRARELGTVIVLSLTLSALVTAGFWVVVTARRATAPRSLGGAIQLLAVDRPFPVEGRFRGDPYVGSQVCAGCHPGESALHFTSGHALTLRPAARRALSRRLDRTTVVDPEQPAVHWSYHYRDGELWVAREAAGQVERWIVDYAFGSGHHATTFVSMIDPDIPSLLEHRLTYFTQADKLDITPGQGAHLRSMDKRPHGRLPTPRDSLKCFRCHSTQTAAQDDGRIDLETMIPNVSCERCHGPARAHVAAARRGAGDAELLLPFGPERWTTESLLELCGACHRHPSRARPEQIRRDDPHLARFQPVGLMQSKCYLGSAGAFSCVTCHDPHARASADRASYDAKCLECHGGPKEVAEPLRTAPPKGKVCTVSPRDRCVECHMPRVDSGQHVLFTDHWIRIRSPDESPASVPPNSDHLEFPGSDLN